MSEWPISIHSYCTDQQSVTKYDQKQTSTYTIEQFMNLPHSNISILFCYQTTKISLELQKCYYDHTIQRFSKSIIKIKTSKGTFLNYDLNT